MIRCLNLRPAPATTVDWTSRSSFRSLRSPTSARYDTTPNLDLDLVLYPGPSLSPRNLRLAYPAVRRNTDLCPTSVRYAALILVWSGLGICACGARLYPFDDTIRFPFISVQPFDPCLNSKPTTQMRRMRRIWDWYLVRLRYAMLPSAPFHLPARDMKSFGYYVYTRLWWCDGAVATLCPTDPVSVFPFSLLVHWPSPSVRLLPPSLFVNPCFTVAIPFAGLTL